MKKELIVAIAFSLFAVNAFAAAPAGLQGFTNSKNVDVGYAGNTSTYGAATKHTQGDKCYGGTSASSYIWMKNCTAGSALGTDIPSAPSVPSDSTVQTGWSSM